MKDFIYIYSCPRSGTYLLQMLMNQSFSVSFPVETQFIAPFGRYLFLWGDLERENKRQQLLNAIYDFIELFTQEVLWSKKENHEKEKSLEYTLLVTRPSRDRIISESNSFSALVNNIFREYSRLDGKERWGDKSSIFEPIPVDHITGMMPEIKVIHVLRDGRDVYLSWKKTWHGPATVSEGARLWVEHVARKRDWGKRHPDRYLEIKYEELITDCDRVLSQVAKFIGERRNSETPNLERNQMAQLLAEVDTHSLLAGKVKADNREKWRSEMTDIDILRFETIASRLLIELGYPCKYGDAATSNPVKSKLYFLRGKVPTVFRKQFWKRRVKYNLPLLIYLARLVGVSLPKVATKIFGGIR